MALKGSFNGCFIFENKQNWLLNEFIKNASVQFIDAISSEITGLEFKIPKNSI